MKFIKTICILLVLYTFSTIIPYVFLEYDDILSLVYYVYVSGVHFSD